ncbi:DUF6406 domain-containing protein [Streptomyces sp. NPDC056463]|uniref:DUF6406 domain-containing protein n=1 Tax=Streptomyces sp. NPDC056463 TaxID=3345827 RepID=UPI0036CE3E74
MTSEVRMRTGVPAPFGDIDFILAHVQVREGQPPLASFTVVAEKEQDYDLVPGDTFLVRGETWGLRPRAGRSRPRSVRGPEARRVILVHKRRGTRRKDHGESRVPCVGRCGGRRAGSRAVLDVELRARGRGVQDGAGFKACDPAERTFYAELRPISDAYDPEALAVSGLDRGRLAREGQEPAQAMNAAAAWLAGGSEGAPLRDAAIEQGELFQNLMRWDGAV